jgi:hypothetical protein
MQRYEEALSCLLHDRDELARQLALLESRMLINGTSTSGRVLDGAGVRAHSPAGMTTVWAGFKQPHRAHCVQMCM